MVGSVIVGFIISGLWPDLSTWIGAAIVVVAGLYTPGARPEAAFCEGGAG